MKAIGSAARPSLRPIPWCPSQRAARWAGLLLLLLAGALYLLTLDDGLRVGELLGGDLITHQYAQVLGRPANAPGYPVYSMLGWLWFRIGRAVLPFFNPTQVLSLFSTLWALASLAVLYMVLLEITGLWPLAWLTAGFYAVTYFFWYYAVTTEQYASAVFQTLLFVLWAFRWQRSRADRYLLYSALNAGFALSNLITVLFIVPGLVLFYLIQEPELLRRRRLLAQVTALTLLPLTSYLFVYWAGRAHPDWSGIAWRGGGWFWEFLSTQQGRSELTWSFGGAPLDYPWLFLAELTPGVCLAGLAGILLLGKPRALLIYPTLIIYLLFSYIDRFGNWYQVLMPIYPLLLMGLAAAAGAVWEAARRKGLARAVLTAGLLALVILRCATNLPRADQHGRPDADAIPVARALLADRPA
ncbi:MAG: protein O-mannosyl-transferase family, partial [Anaerolineae bacterium]